MLDCHVKAKTKKKKKERWLQDAAYLALSRPWTKADEFPVSDKIVVESLD